ncbi:tetratricopeptide repeat protein [Paracoccus aurantiacus]|uniref:tetratricopeptide repeat protein n=1 Tax=Paracoccus aurantiacus TaxID=2599412 RepID=UPI0011BF4337
MVVGFFIALFCTTPAIAQQQQLPPYQPTGFRQVCQPAALRVGLDENDAGQIASGTTVAILDVGFADDGHAYFEVEAANGQAGWIPTKTTANFCDFADRKSSAGRRFLAPPNSCHLIAASRRTLDEINAFAAEYSDFLPTMSAYKSDNGWYAVSFGLISTSIAQELLEAADNLPADAYCSDGANYIDLAEFTGAGFTSARTALPDESATARYKAECLQGNGAACTDYANDVFDRDAAEEKGGDDDEFEMFRYWLLGCMRGEAEACIGYIRSSSVYLEYPMRTAWPGGDDNTPGLYTEMDRIGCDDGIAVACNRVGGNMTKMLSGDAAAWASGFSALIASCEIGDKYGCRDMFRAMKKRADDRNRPFSARDQFFAAELWADRCDPSPNGSNDGSCAPVYENYSKFLSAPINDPFATVERRAIATAFLRRGCEGWRADACLYYSQLSDQVSVEDRDWGASRAASSCALYDKGNAVCQNLQIALKNDLPSVTALKRGDFEALAQRCGADNSLAAEEACHDAMLYYIRQISATDLAPLESALQQACEGTRIAGCSELATLYSPHSIAGENFRFTGSDQPERRLQALRTGCQPQSAHILNCTKLAEMQAERGQDAEAQRSFRLACDAAQMTQSDAHAQQNACFESGLHALRAMRDEDMARRDFRRVCDDGASSNMPYACKHLGLLEQGGSSGAGDIDAALRLFARSCYPPGAQRGDGEGCLHYGRMLLEHRDSVRWDAEVGRYVVLPRPIDQGQRDVTTLATAASDAFATGCASRWEAACNAHETLIADWIAGSFPTGQVNCQIRQREDVLLSDKICGLIVYRDNFLSAENEMRTTEAEIYIWPDGDRTVVKYMGGPWSLNGVLTQRRFIAPEMSCLENPETQRSFCASSGYDRSGD